MSAAPARSPAAPVDPRPAMGEIFDMRTHTPFMCGIGQAGDPTSKSQPREVHLSGIQNGKDGWEIVEDDQRACVWVRYMKGEWTRVPWTEVRYARYRMAPTPEAAT